MFILSTMQHVHSLNCKISRRKYSNFYFFNGLNTFRLFERIFLTWKPLIREEENVRKAFSPKGARHTLCSFLIKVACTCIESGYFRCGTSRGFLYCCSPVQYCTHTYRVSIKLFASPLFRKNVATNDSQ